MVFAPFFIFCLFSLGILCMHSRVGVCLCGASVYFAGCVFWYSFFLWWMTTKGRTRTGNECICCCYYCSSLMCAWVYACCWIFWLLSEKADIARVSECILFSEKKRVLVECERERVFEKLSWPLRWEFSIELEYPADSYCCYMKVFTKACNKHPQPYRWEIVTCSLITFACMYPCTNAKQNICPWLHTTCM